MKHKSRRNTEFEAPRLDAVDLLNDSGLGFSEPPPPGGSAAPGEGREHGERKKDAEDDEAFDWL